MGKYIQRGIPSSFLNTHTHTHNECGQTMWNILVLSDSLPESPSPGEISRSIINFVKKSSPGVRVFIPAGITNHESSFHVDYLLQGYAFIQGVHGKNLLKLEDNKYVERVLFQDGKFATLTDEEIDRMRDRTLNEIDLSLFPGDTVVITAGPYKNLNAEVIECTGDDVQVSIQFRSKQDILTLPKGFLKREVANTEDFVLTELRKKTLDLSSAVRLLCGKITVSVPSFVALKSCYRKVKLLSVLKKKHDHTLGFFGPFLDIQRFVDRYFQLKNFVDRITQIKVEPSHEKPRNRRTQSGVSRSSRTAARSKRPRK